MNPRKLIKLGNSSYAIALPKDWIDKSGLKKGDNVFIMPNSNGELIVQASFHSNGNEREVNLELAGKNPRDINREIIASYINGGNLIKIKLDKKDYEFVKDVLNDLFGVEIIESKQNNIVAKEVIDMSSISVDSITRRIDNSVRNIFEEIEDFLKNGKITPKEYSEIMSADKDVNRFYFLLWRLMVLGIDDPSLLSTLKTSSSSLVYSWLTGMNIEKIGDDLKRVTEIISKSKMSSSEIKWIEKVFKELKEQFINALNSYHLKDKNLAFGITKNKDQIISLCSSAPESLNEISSLFLKIHSNVHYISKYVLYFINENKKIV